MEKEMSLPSLEPMIGRVCRVYKGGPESRVGKLLAVNDDHIVMYTENDGVLYYYLRHIKSIAEDTKEIADGDSGEAVEYSSYDNMEDLLDSLVGQQIRIDRGGPESRTGTLLACTYDHLTMETKEDGVLYVLLEHIKSINVEQQQNNGENAEGGEKAEGEENRPAYFDEDGFDELLDAVKYRWIKINRGGPESIEGVLVDSSGDHLVLVVGQEVLRIPCYHIRNVSVATKKAEEKKEEQQENKQQGNNESKLSSDDISYIEKMLSEKYKNRGSHSSDHGSDRGSDRGSHKGSSRRSNRGSHKGSSRRRGSAKGRRGSNRGSAKGRRSNSRGSNRKSNKKRKSRSNGTRLTFFTR